MLGSVLFCMAEIQKMNGKACVKMHKMEKETTKIIYKVQTNKRKVRNTNGKMHIYSYENSAEWVAFLTFASMLMYTENEARLAVNMRKQSAFSAPIGSKNPFASWNERKDDNERINLYQSGNE